MGRLIPAGTGVGAYKKIPMHVDVAPPGEEIPSPILAAQAAAAAAAAKAQAEIILDDAE